MKHIALVLVSLAFLSTGLISQNTVPEVTLKVAEKSGFLGMGKPRFVKIALSSRGEDKILTSENVNAGPLFYFTMKDSGEWVIDEDFIKEELVKLKIDQDGTTLGIDAVGTPLKGTDHFQLTFSCKKTLLLHKPFKFVFTMDATTDIVSMEVPQEYWPGYAKYTTLALETEKLFSDGKVSEAIASTEQILQDQQLKIYTDFDSLGSKRLAMYQKLFSDHCQKYQEMLSNKSVETKQKIVSSEEFITIFTFVSGNAANDQYLGQSTKTAAGDLAEKASGLLTRSKLVRDSLNQALDEQTVRFLIQGSSAERIDFKYKYIVETVAYAFSSVNFEDTTAAALTVVVPEQFKARLQKYALTNAYETFVRVVNNRWKAKKPIFPPGFLDNLQKDTSSFSLPFYSTLKAIEDFYKKDYTGAKAEIDNVMKTSYAYELTERIDQLRILINTIGKNVPRDVLQRIKEGNRAEERGENEKAIEQYKDAMLVAEDYAPAAFALGKIYDRNGDSYTANNYFQKAVAADSQYYTAYRFLYNNFFKNANFKPMIDLLTQALSRGNDYFDIHYYLGIAYNGSAQYDLAIEQYESALGLNGKNINANIQAGISYQNMKSYTKAREYFNRAIVIDPENQTATENLKRLDELQK